MSRILALRLSALGDVAMSVPVIYSFAENYPDSEIVVVSREKWGALFANMPSNVCFYGIDLQEYRGIRGLERLFGELRREEFDAVADFHNVLRTKYLDMRFRMAGVPVAVINKGRREKKELTRPQHKRLVQLKTSTMRYAEVLEKLGFGFDVDFHSIFGDDEGDVGTLAPVVGWHSTFCPARGKNLSLGAYGTRGFTALQTTETQNFHFRRRKRGTTYSRRMGEKVSVGDFSGWKRQNVR